MLNTPDSNSQKKLKDGMESVSEQIEVSKEDFVNAAGNIKANIQSESERFQEDLMDLKEKVFVCPVPAFLLPDKRSRPISNWQGKKRIRPHIAPWSMLKKALNQQAISSRKNPIRRWASHWVSVSYLAS